MKKILIIEDELAYLKLMHDQLSEQGYDIIEAKDGLEGLKFAKAEKPDLILLDIRMPIMDGMTMLDLLRKDDYGKTAKVIILTNIEPDDKILEEVLEGLPTYYLIKSDTKLDDLLEKIKDVLSE